MKAKYEFYEIVFVKPDIVSKEKKLSGHSEIRGIIKGISKNDNGEWGYAVLLDVTGTVWDFNESELYSSGKFADPEYNTSGETKKVIVSPDGKGDLKNKE